jgi:hypothetical protein
MDFDSSWDLITMDGNKYTIFWGKTKEELNSIHLSNDEYYVTIVEGHKRVINHCY